MQRRLMEPTEERPDSYLDVVVVGSCFFDLLTYIPRFPKPGETIHGEKFLSDFGGKGANMCIMAAKLGGRNVMVSMVGDDTFGRETIGNFKKFGVNTDWINITNEAATGISNSIVDNDGEPSFISIPGANKLLTVGHVHQAKSVIEKGKVLIANCGIPLSTALEALKLGKASGLVTVYNPAPKVLTELDGEFYTNTDVLVLNMDEAASLTRASVGDKDEVMSACLWFHNCGVRHVVISMREHGAMGSVRDLHSDGDMKSLKNSVFHVSARHANGVDTTGAGDALAGAIAYFLACHPHLTFQEIVTRAVAIATQTVEIEGVQKSYPDRKCLPAELFS